MKVIKTVGVCVDGQDEVCFDVDIQISAADISHLYEEAPESGPLALSALQSVIHCLQGIPDNLIAEMQPKVRAIVFEHLSQQTQRYAPENNAAE